MPWWPSIVLLALVLLGSWDLLQRKHSLYRNYPLTGHFRNIAEEMRTQIRQYFIESDTDGTPFDREQRSLVYQRAKNVVDTMPFGTERRVTDVGYEWINHSIAPRPKGVEPFAHEDRQRAMRAPVFVVGAEHFRDEFRFTQRRRDPRAESRRETRQLRARHRRRRSVSDYHLEGGGDIVWEIGTGYFGCRHERRPLRSGERSKTRASADAVRMVEIKLSQGAKPGHGGILARRESHRGNRPRTRRSRRRRLRVAAVSPGVRLTARAARVRRAAARSQRRQTGRLQTLHRPQVGIPRHLQSDDRRRASIPTSS